MRAISVWVACALLGACDEPDDCIKYPRTARNPYDLCVPQMWTPPPEPDSGPDSGPLGPLPVLVIVDSSEEENMNGTAGADICHIEVLCAGDTVTPIRVQLEPGEGFVCQEETDVCSTGRADPDAALTEEEECDFLNVPSDFVSLGMQGELALEFGQDLRGCQVSVTEHVGNQYEGYEIFICEEIDGTRCADQALEVGPNGGHLEATLPDPPRAE